MNAKTIVKYLLLSIVCLGFVLVGYQQFGTSANNMSTDFAAVTTVAPVLKNGVNVYYFHGNQRCTTCIRMEKFTRETVMNSFFKEVSNGEVQLNIVNVDLTDNQHYVDDYQLAFRTVVVSTTKDGVETQWRRLDKLWELANDEMAYQEYVAEEIEAMLSRVHG
tara:strand:- start:14289 stop:14777 length:489 start_codon:yes stop_codon:yes gene_type:complete